MTTINRFTGDYEFLSNFHYQNVTYKGHTYDTNEHAFQAAKTDVKEERGWVSKAKTPGEAKRRGRQVTLREDWEEDKDRVMLVLCRRKFKVSRLRILLLETGDAKLVEGNTWGDQYWGVYRGKGKNKLGLILMQVREELLNASR